jgi:hypothetical protein
MDYEEKNRRFWDLVRTAQYPKSRRKWASLSNFRVWAESWGGRIKGSNRKRKGFVVRSFVANGNKMCYEFPEEFVDRCLVLGDLP